MLRPLHLVLCLWMVVLVVSLEESPEPNHVEIEPAQNNANDLDADATSWGYARPWRYGGGWRSGWGGWRGGWGLGGRGWIAKGVWW